MANSEYYVKLVDNNICKDLDDEISSIDAIIGDIDTLIRYLNNSTSDDINSMKSDMLGTKNSLITWKKIINEKKESIKIAARNYQGHYKKWKNRIGEAKTTYHYANGYNGGPGTEISKNLVINRQGVLIYIRTKQLIDVAVNSDSGYFYVKYAIKDSLYRSSRNTYYASHVSLQDKNHILTTISTSQYDINIDGNPFSYLSAGK